MTTDRTTDTIVETWLADGFATQPDVETMLRNIRTGVVVTPQRHHRWWPLGRTTRPPVPGRGHSPAGGSTMFSALKFVAAGVIVALFGGFLLAGALTTPQGDELVPAAPSASPPAGTGGTVAVTLDLEAAQGYEVAAILYLAPDVSFETAAGLGSGFGSFVADVAANPFTITETIREGAAWLDAPPMADQPVAAVPPGDHTLGIFVSSRLGPFGEFVPAAPVEWACWTGVTVRPGARTSLGISVPAILPGLGFQDLPAHACEATTRDIRTDILPGVELTVEEVEPGVLRVTSDGVRGLASVDAVDIVAGYDGGIWLLQEEGFLRLGGDGSHEWPDQSSPDGGRIFEVAPDGTMWVIAARGSLLPGSRAGDALRSVDGEVWVPQPCPDDCVGITLAPDGEIWASWPDAGWTVGHLGSAGWEPLDRPIPPVGNTIFDRLYFTDTGDLYATFVAYGPRLARYHDGSWSEVSYLSFDTSVDVGRDGTVWQSGRGTLIAEASSSADTRKRRTVDGSDAVASELSGGLARLTGGEWTLWTPAELPDLDLPTRPDDEFGVAPDGSLWVSRSCHGLARFDGDTLDRFLPGQCISMDIAADGSVWVLADQEGGKDLYVITPEAVAAKETEVTPEAVTESPSPMTTEALLPGVTLTVEEIEPGVFHTLNDGVRDLARQPIGDWGSGATVTVDETGAVWRFTPDGAFRLGAEGEWHVGGSDTDLPWPDSATARGRVVAGPDGLTDLLGPESATPEELGLDGGVAALEAQADGTLWLLGDGGSLVRVPPGGAAEVLDWKDAYDGLVDGLAVTPDGDAWLMAKPEVGRYPAEVFLHFAGDDWEVVPVPTESLPGPLWAGPLEGNQKFDVGPDGTLWADLVYRLAGGGDPRARSLARYDGSGWAIFGEADGVRPWYAGMWPYNSDREMRVAPDGSVWVIASGPDDEHCSGLGRFDGESWVSYVPDMCIASYDVAPDGAIWVVARDKSRHGGLSIETYVITPGAVAARVATVTEPPPAAVTASPSPSPMTTAQLLSDMVTEEVEPGVFRLVDDGYRDITHLGGAPYWGEAVMVDTMGGVWRIVVNERYFRLGAEEEWPMDGQPLLVFSDGRLVTAESVLSGPSDWETVTLEGLGLSIPVAEEQDDGTVWFLGDGGVLVRVPPDSLPEAVDWAQAYDGAVDGRNLVVTADGEVWLVGRRWTDIGPTDAFLRFDGEEWQVVPAPDEDERVVGLGVTFDVGPDGTLWTVGDADLPHRHLARYDGSGWTIFGDAEGVRPWGGQRIGVWLSVVDVVRVASDGAVWVNGAGPDDDGCGGLARFDGGSWASFLRESCIYDFDFAPDGAVWAVAGEPQDVYEGEDGLRSIDAQTYVITPEAVADTE